MNSTPSHPVPPNSKEADDQHPSTRPPEAKAGSRGRILLVDDDPEVGQVLSKWLRKLDYQVPLAASPVDAEKLLSSSRFDLVISDVYMPGNFNLEWVERLLKRPSSPPVLLITGSPDLAIACRAANLPVAGYLLKPLDFELLDQVIQRTLQEHLRRREFTHVVQGIAQLLGARQVESTPEEDALIARLTQLCDDLSTRTDPAAERPGDEAWRAAIIDTISVIEKTKHSFRSKELGNLRQRLQQLVRSGISPCDSD